ncbi:hypothetical protein [Cupriavidus necator]|uniref:hypothetical protein n=1 Tax=Cupriavidus necator TaxID=106590 RepID=UPI00278B8314|nr:hypothetical protein [Cupriavidus necator]
MRERRWHLIVPFCCAATGLVLGAVFSHNTALSLAALALSASSRLATSPLFWTLPTRTAPAQSSSATCTSRVPW